MDYYEEIEEIYQCTKNFLDENGDVSKEYFVSAVIFDFLTYDADIDEILANKMLEVLDALINRITFEYIESSGENYINYIMMINTPFLIDKIDWGTSIRTAWLYNHHPVFLDNGRLEIPKGDMHKFIEALLKWIKE